MRYDSAIFINQYPLVKKFVYHMIYYRSLSKAYSDCGNVSEFWAQTVDAHILQAVINWCKVFGSEGCNATHWKKLNVVEKDNLKNSFFTGLEQYCGMSHDDLTLYWKEITGFRNKYAAHTEIGYKAPVPSFDNALNIAFFYDRWIRKVISPDSFAEGDLKLFATNLQKKVEKPLAAIIAGSMEILNGN